MSDLDFTTYLSPFTWRYGSSDMRHIFSEENKYKIWRKIWVALAQEEFNAGLLTKKELDDLKKNQNNIDIKKILEIEKETKHDVVAAIKEFSQQAKVGGGKIHLGATSMDIVDNTDILRMQEGLNLTEEKLIKTIKLFAKKVEENTDLVCMGYTHLQTAEPTTIGYRLAFYLQDLLVDLEFLKFVKNTIKAKGLKGAVGTRASYKAVLSKSKMTAEQLDNLVMKNLGIESDLISSQTYSRKYDFLVVSVLQNISSSLAKFAGDLRILQSPGFGELSEPFGKNQVGSSAMPFKKNPINSEKICSLARFVGTLPQILLENAAVSYLERTLDDSANKRVVIPEAFLAVDEILQTAEKIIEDLVVNKQRIDFNLKQYAPFSATESILIEAVKNGADRQETHELLREIAMKAWEVVQKGGQNPMENFLKKDQNLAKFVSVKKIDELLDVRNHIGDAPKRARQLTKKAFSVKK